MSKIISCIKKRLDVLLFDMRSCDIVERDKRRVEMQGFPFSFA